LKLPAEKLKLSMGDKSAWEWLMFAKKLSDFEILSFERFAGSELSVCRTMLS
jgi:hypothetical protein